MLGVGKSDFVVSVCVREQKAPRFPSHTCDTRIEMSASSTAAPPAAARRTRLSPGPVAAAPPAVQPPNVAPDGDASRPR